MPMTTTARAGDYRELSMMEMETTVTTRVFRPFKITALVLCIIAAVGSVAAIVNDAWVTSATFEQGLWRECYNTTERVIGPNTPMSGSNPMVCYPAQPSAWLTSARAFALVSLVILIIGILCAIIGFIMGQRYQRMFIASGVFALLAGVCLMLPLIIFPTQFLGEPVVLGRTGFELHWGWGLAFGVFFIEFAAGLVLIITKDTQEIHYNEKPMYTNGGTVE